MPSKKLSEDDFGEYNSRMSNGNGLKTRRRCYFPTRHGGFCVNAVTGVRYPYTQGSFEALRLYQVIDSSGKCDSNGYTRTRWDPSNQTPNFLFYDSPEQYSRHQKVDINPKSSYQWHIDVKRMFPDDVFDKTAYIEIRMRKHNVGETPVSDNQESATVDTHENSDDEWN